MEDAWKAWSSSRQTIQLKALPLIHIWGIWLARNRSIFLEKASSLEEVARKGLDIISYFPQERCKAPTGSPLVFIYNQEFNYIYIHIQFDNQNVV